MLPAEIWRTQPHLRTVVTFIARNIAQLGLHSFQRSGEVDRQRLRDGALVQTLARPNAKTTTYELVFGLVGDLALYDVAYLHYAKDANAPSGWSLYRLPPVWVTPMGGDAFGFAQYKVQAIGGVNAVYLAADSIIDFHGWNPDDARYGASPVGALKAILAEQMMAVAQFQDRINTFLVPILDPRPGVYVEFNIAAKMQGNFEEQAATLSTSTGAPWMLRSEARARMNLPSIPDADTLVVPLNVLVGGQASPRDSVPPKSAPALIVPAERHVKARAPQAHEDKYAEVVHKFFRKQGGVVKSRLGAKSDEDWWDEERWDGEL